MSVDAVAIAQKQLDAYNAQDLALYCSFFTEDVVVADLNGAVSTDGLAAYEQRYRDAFAKFPNNKAALVSRMAISDTVIDYERVERGDGVTAPFDVIAIYTFRGGKIARVDFVK